MKIKKILVILLSVVIFCILIVWMLFNTSMGNNLLKFYYQNKINHYFSDMKIDTFKVNYNDFFMSLHEGKNHYKLYGQLYPFDAIVEGKIKEIKITKHKLKDNITLNGHIEKQKQGYLLHSMVYFNKNVGFLDINFGKYKVINFRTDNVDMQYFVKNFNIKNIKGLNAKINLDLLVNNNHYFVKTNIKGLYKNNPFDCNTDFSFNSLDFITFEGIVKSEILNGKYKGVYKNNKLICDADFNKFDLSLLNLLYPFKGKIYLKIRHDKAGLIKFFSKDFRGFKDDNINIEFNMPVQKFFSYLGIYNPFDEGNVIGRIVISNKGSFNCIIENALLKKDITKKLKLRNNFFEKIFIKGYFDNKYVIFDLLSDNKNNTINIKNGKILIYPKIKASFVIIINNDKEEDYYKFNKSRLFLLKRKFLVNDNNQILVF